MQKAWYDSTVLKDKKIYEARNGLEQITLEKSVPLFSG